MTRSSPLLNAFSAGEISPLLWGRSDYQRFQTGLRACRGFLPLREGGVTRAPGTLLRGSSLNNGAGRLVAFQFAADDAVVLEFTANRMRVWRYGALVMDGGEPFVLVTPYDLAAVHRLQWSQSADVIYLCDGAIAIQKLSRFALNNWTIGAATFDTGPFRVQNLDRTLTVQASAATGTVTLTASSALFVPAHAGSLLRLSAENYSDIALWTGQTPITIGDVMRYGVNIYRLTAGTNTGVNPPIHDEGIEKYDFADGTSWEFLSGQSGIVRITGVTDSTSATANVLSSLPKPVVDHPTYRWEDGAWSVRFGFPGSIEIHDQRLCAAATPTEPRTVWFSTVGDYQDFEPSTEADGAFAFTIAGQDSVNRILWLKRGAKGLHIGALGEEYSTRSSDPGQVIGPTTAVFGFDSAIGSRNTPPIAPDGWPIFISRDGGRIFELRYSLEQDANRARELSLPSQHLGSAGFDEIVWQAVPQRLAWVRLGNGELAAMLHDPSEDVLGWALHSLAGGMVESLCVSTDASGARDIVTALVRRIVNGVERRFVEELADTYGMLTGAQAIAQAVHFFCSVVFVPDTPQHTFSLPHLPETVVWAWTDRGQFGPLATSDVGAVTLPVAVGRATIGLFDTTHYFETLPLPAPARDGNTTGRRQRGHARLGLRVHRTVGGLAEPVEYDFGQPERVQANPVYLVPRLVAEDYVAAFSGPLRLDAPTGYTDEASYRFRPDGGAPMTVLATVPTVEAGGD